MGVSVSGGFRGSIFYDNPNAKITVRWDLINLGAAIAGRSQDAAEAGAQEILERANQMVPYDFANKYGHQGLLQSSGEVVRIPNQGAGSVMIIYGTVYAAHLHEHPEFNFQGNREGKWLEKALAVGAQGAMGAMMAEISKSFSGVGAFGDIPL
jgi:hypothetical protein